MSKKRDRAAREELIQRVLDSSINKSGDGYTAHDVARLIRKSSAYAGSLLKEMFDRKLVYRAPAKTARGVHFVYSSRNRIRVDFRVDPTVHEEVERLMRGW